MAQNPNYTVVSFSLRKDLHEKLKKTFPKYGDVSKVMRKLLTQLLEGKVKLS